MAKTLKNLKKPKKSPKAPEQPANMRELPETFRITLLGREWRIFFVDAQEMGAIVNQPEQNGIQGLAYRTKSCIFIKKGMRFEHTLSTLFHEAFHGVTTCNQGTCESQQESINEELAANLAGLLFVEFSEQMPLIAPQIKKNCSPEGCPFFVCIE